MGRIVKSAQTLSDHVLCSIPLRYELKRVPTEVQNHISYISIQQLMFAIPVTTEKHIIQEE